MRLLLLSLFIPSLLSAQDHLLISEVTMAPSAGEFIEIYNPTANVIDLSNYYLSDNMGYATVPSGTVVVPSTDFLVKFPAGATIPAFGVVVVAMDGHLFDSLYAPVTANFQIKRTSMTVTNMDTIKVDSNPSLTNGGEAIILSYWDNQSDLMSDVDMVNVGVPSAINEITAKTGLLVDGPDTDTISTAYLMDQMTMGKMATSPNTGFSAKRILLEVGNEVTTGGNGITGHDETTEAILITWDATFTAPDPGVTGLLTGIAINATNTNKFKAYPNPAKNEFKIDFKGNFVNGNTQVSLYAMNGTLVDTFVMNGDEMTVSTSSYQKGIYFLKSGEGKNTFVIKMVIE